MSKPGFHSRGAGTSRSALGTSKPLASYGDHVATRLEAISKAGAQRTATAIARGHEQPGCATCGRPMNAKMGPRGQFWGCPAYPLCRGTRPMNPPA